MAAYLLISYPNIFPALVPANNSSTRKKLNFFRFDLLNTTNIKRKQKLLIYTRSINSHNLGCLKAVLQILYFGSPGFRSVIICTDADPDLNPSINKQKSKKYLDFFFL